MASNNYNFGFIKRNYDNDDKQNCSNLKKNNLQKFDFIDDALNIVNDYFISEVNNVNTNCFFESLINPFYFDEINTKLNSNQLLNNKEYFNSCIDSIDKYCNGKIYNTNENYYKKLYEEISIDKLNDIYINNEKMKVSIQNKENKIKQNINLINENKIDSTKNNTEQLKKNNFIPNTSRNQNNTNSTYLINNSNYSSKKSKNINSYNYTYSNNNQNSLEQSFSNKTQNSPNQSFSNKTQSSPNQSFSNKTQNNSNIKDSVNNNKSTNSSSKFNNESIITKSLNNKNNINNALNIKKKKIKKIDKKIKKISRSKTVCNPIKKNFLQVNLDNTLLNFAKLEKENQRKKLNKILLDGNEKMKRKLNKSYDIPSVFEVLDDIAILTVPKNVNKLNQKNNETINIIQTLENENENKKDKKNEDNKCKISPRFSFKYI